MFVWRNFQYHFQRHPVYRKSSARLYKVKIHETDNNVVEYMGEEGESSVRTDTVLRPVENWSEQAPAEPKGNGAYE